MRRLAAILAADVAGYSRLIGADEAGTLNMLRALRKDIVEPTLQAAGATDDLATPRRFTLRV